jgi:hypothetical protein
MNVLLASAAADDVKDAIKFEYVLAVFLFDSLVETAI